MPLSRLTDDQINSIFNLNVLPEKLPELRARFALIPASEVAEIVYANRAKDHHILISDNQCRALNIAKGGAVADAMFVSCISPKDLPANETIRDGGLSNPMEVFKRMRPKLEGQDVKDLEHALLHFWDNNQCIGIYYVLPDRLLSQLKVSQLHSIMLQRIMQGLSGEQKGRVAGISIPAGLLTSAELKDPV